MNGVSEQTQEQYIDELENDLKAACAVVEAVKQLFIGATLTGDGMVYCVSAGTFNAVMDMVEMLRE